MPDLEMAGWLILAWLAAFVVNLMPALMPPIAAVLAAFKVGADLPLLPLTLVAAPFGALGRYLMARGAHAMRPWLRDQDRRNAEALGDWFTNRGRWRWPLIAVYCMGPFPSNALFIAAGAGRIPAGPIALIFALSRAISDTFWVWTGALVVESFSEYLADWATDWRTIVLQVVGAVVVVMIFRLPWASWLGLAGRSKGS